MNEISEGTLMPESGTEKGSAYLLEILGKAQDNLSTFTTDLPWQAFTGSSAEAIEAVTELSHVIQNILTIQSETLRGAPDVELKEKLAQNTSMNIRMALQRLRELGIEVPEQSSK